MRKLVCVLALLAASCEVVIRDREPVPAKMPYYARRMDEAPANDPARLAIEDVLDGFHAAAAAADGRAYFGYLDPGAIFFGTDATERWTKHEFQAYAEPFFAEGRGWTYQPIERHVFVAGEGRVAWFDERLLNAKYGETRGTGVLRQVDGRWLIVQYNLTFTIPNEVATDVVELVRRELER